MTMIQIPSLILPQAWTIGTETEIIDDLVEHTSIEIPVEFVVDKTVQILAVEAVAAGVPGPLWVWVETSPYPSANNVYWDVPLPFSPVYWAAIGGGGGALAPTAPLIIAGTGVNGVIHTETIAWQIHSPWVRIVVQTPVAAALPLAFWSVQIIIQGKGN